MTYYTTLSDFYKSKEWEDFRALIIAQRTAADGFVYDEITGKPIIQAYDIIAHHITPLTLDNVNDVTVSLNPENIQLVSFKTHNEIHKRFGVWTRHVYIVHGSPLSGKSSFVSERAELHDLVVDMDKIREGITNNPKYIRSGRLDDNAFGVRDCLFNMIKSKYGKWVNAWVIQTLPYKGERERIARELGAELIHIPCDKETALLRLASQSDGRDVKEWTKYIDTYFTRYQA